LERFQTLPVLFQTLLFLGSRGFTKKGGKVSNPACVSNPAGFQRFHQKRFKPSGKGSNPVCFVSNPAGV
jgi:hypothetical protein